MKKFLAILGAVGLTATATMAVISCQVEISGDTLKDLSEKFNKEQESKTIAYSNASRDPQGLRDQLVQLLTKTLVDNYGMDGEGYFAASKITDIKIGDFDLVKDSVLTKAEITSSVFENKPQVSITIEKHQFNFKVNFTFNESSETD